VAKEIKIMQDFTRPTQLQQMRLRLIAMVCLTIAPDIALAGPPPNAAAGGKLAQHYCAECHVVTPSAKRGWTDAPAFAAIANRPNTTAQALSGYIQQPHMHMVNTGRPPAEANDLAAYIISLRKN
jgi:cytochrome c2